MAKDKTAVGVALILCAAILWGTTGTAQSFAPLTLSPLWVGTMRLVVASVFFLICVATLSASDFTVNTLRSMPLGFLVLAAIGMAVYNLAFFAGIRSTSVAGGTALALGSGPVWAGALEAIFTRQLPAKGWWVGVCIAIAGLFIVTGGGAAESLSWPVHGIALCLLSGLSYAIYGLSTKRILKTVAPLVSVAVVFTLAAVIAVVAAGMTTDFPELTTKDMTILVWLGVVATGLAYLLFSSGLRYVSTSTGIALALAEPIAALLLAVIIVGERPASEVYVGIGIMLAGLGLLIFFELQSDKRFGSG